jgi:two-component system, cell cycle sensor histidine kinase and response regulator CckA
MEGDQSDKRLIGVLEAARARLALSWIGLLEHGSPEGRLRWVWRVPVAELERVLLTRDVVARWCEGHRDDEPTAVALQIDPATGPGPDSLAVFMASTPPDPAALAEACAVIAQALSTDRRARLAAIAFDAIDQAVDAIEITDREARFIFVNRAWQRLFGYQPREVLGASAAQIFRDRQSPQHDAAFYQFSMQVLEGGGPWTGSLTSRASSGEHVMCETAVVPFVHGEGEARFLGNVAVRRQLEHRAGRDAALEGAHREFRAVLSAIPDAVLVLRDKKVYFVNAALLALMGEQEAEVIGRFAETFLQPEDASVFEANTSARFTVARLVRADGGHRLLDLTAAGSISFEGQPAIILLGRDQTDRRIAEEQLARSEKHSALGALSAGVAHEINNPLAYMIANLQQLTTSSTSHGAERELLLEALDGARRIKSIVDELRVFIRRDELGVVGAVDVERAFTSAVNIMQNQIRHRARLVRQHGSGLFAAAREGPLVQALVNLLANAAQAMGDRDSVDGRIEIGSRALPGSRVELSVTDTGPGIPPDLLPRIFDPSFTTKGPGDGSGLGLTITKRIVEQYGGTVAVVSQLGVGTRFTIELPSAGTPAAAEPSNPPVAATASIRGRILVVDDEAAVARALARMLSEHDVEVVHDAVHAIERVREGTRYDAILCDVMMPGMGGPELFETVTAVRPELADAFLFMTGGAFDAKARQFLEARADRTIDKPFDREVVRMKIEAALQRSSPKRSPPQIT